MLIPTFLALGAGAALLVLYNLYQNWLQERGLKHIPIHQFEDGDNSRARYISDLKELLETGYRKYNKHGQAFKVPIPVGGYKLKYRVILPRECLEEIKHLSNNVFSWMLAANVIFAGDYTGAPPRGPWLGKAVRVGIHQNLANITKVLNRNVDDYFARMLPQQKGETMSLLFMKFLVPAVTNITNAQLVGEQLAADAEWVRQACDFSINRYQSADDVRAWPPYLAAIVAPFIPSVKRLRASRVYVKEQLRPIFEELRHQEKQKRGVDKVANGKAVYGFQWLFDGAPKEVTLQEFSDSMMRTIIASIHTTAKTLTIALIDLLSQPEYIGELREEAKQAMRSDGTFDVDSLFKLDCFLKESQRLTPVLVLTMNRIVTRDYTFKSNGLCIPKGTMSHAATAAIATDPDTFGSDSKSFDGRRFQRLREKNASESALKMGMTTTDSLGFGLGNQACPGRFFAVNVLKLTIAKLLANYDIEMERGGRKYEGSRPEYRYYDFSVSPPGDFGMKVTKT